MLQVRREAIHENKPLWIIREDQGDEWREGRILLPSYDMEYQVSLLRGFGLRFKCISPSNTSTDPVSFIIRERC